MKKVLKRSLSFLLTITIVFSSAYVGLSEVDFSSVFVVKAKAASESDLTFAFNDDGKSYSVVDCDANVTGKIVIPETYNDLPVTGIGFAAFRECSKLTNIIIPDSITSIGSRAFYYCENLESATLGNGVTNIGSYAFGHCSSLSKINIPNSVTSIGEYAFYLCETLTFISIPSSVTSIGHSAFYCCINLKSIVINNGVRSIDNCAFQDCENLVSITIPDSVTNIGFEAFLRCDNLVSITVDENNPNYSSVSGVLFNKNITNLIQYPIGKSEPSYSIPEGVNNISSSAFCNCTNLKSIIIPDSVTSIASNAFYGCSNLESVAFPNNVTSIGEYAFCNCERLPSIIISNTVNFIGQYAFAGCTSLTSIVIPNSLTSIEGSVFENCTNLTSVIIPNSVTNIVGSAFYNCKKLISITIPDSVTNIGRYSFDGCENLESVIISDSVTSINDYAFNGCNKLKYVFCPDEDFSLDSKIIGKKNDNLLNAKWHYGATDHTTSDWVVDVNPTCGAEGSKYKECTVCGKITEIDVIPAMGNHLMSDWIFDKYVTCTTGGSKHKECTVCGEVLETVTYPATGHTTGHWIVDSQPTASTPGEQHKECIDCGKVIETETIPQLKPATPKVSTTNEIGGVQVTWNKVSGATKYIVYRRQGGYNTWVNVGTTTGNTLLDKNVKSGIYYVYSVRAYNNAGQYSDFVSANTQTRKFMATPKLTTIYNHQNGLAIKWNAVAGITKGYRVYRRGAGSTYWTYLGTTKNLYFIDSQVKNKSGEYFRYTVIADGDYHSKFDTTGLYLRRLANPTLTSAVSSSAGITVKWGAVKGTTGYYVYRKTANSTWVRVAAVGGTNNTTFLDKTAKKGTTYTYTVRAVYGNTLSSYYSGISCKDKY